MSIVLLIVKVALQDSISYLVIFHVCKIVLLPIHKPLDSITIITSSVILVSQLTNTMPTNLVILVMDLDLKIAQVVVAQIIYITDIVSPIVQQDIIQME